MAVLQAAGGGSERQDAVHHDGIISQEEGQHAGVLYRIACILKGSRGAEEDHGVVEAVRSGQSKDTQGEAGMEEDNEGIL